MNPWDTFEYMAPEIENDRLAWTAAFNEQRQRATHAGESIDVREYGRRAWAQLNPAQRLFALDSMFGTYFWAVYEEERSAQLTAAADAERSYLHPDDETCLSEALLYAQGDGADATVTVIASAVSNVLDELRLLRYRLAVARSDDSTGTDNAR